MPRFFVRSNQVINNKIVIQGVDVNHIKNVLRKSIGDTIEVCNQDDSQDYIVKIEKIDREKLECGIIEKIKNNAESNVYIHIFQGLPKADKMEFIIQKGVELGVSKITPVAMKRSIVKITPKDELKKIQRWQKISEVAAKQCGRNIIPKIDNINKISNICAIINEYDAVLVAYENEKDNSLKNELQLLKNSKNKKLKIAIVIGPEGGLDEQDVEELKKNGAKIITLGKRILRTETVVLNMTSIIMYELET
ncbi:MAG: 16S rRNA (uracil(1498)-N(3))-methyltransferase [Clostridia bacterium]|nr:16S rRNA (uracil(1498)-N(3))-methyltransferase [Clostridia bacterium]